MDMLGDARTADTHPLMGRIVRPLWRPDAAWPSGYPPEVLVLAVGPDWLLLSPQWPPGQPVPSSRCQRLWVSARDIACFEEDD